MASLAPEVRLLCLAARSSRDDRTLDQVRSALLGPLDWDRVAADATAHEVLPLVAATLEAAAGDQLPSTWRTLSLRRRHLVLVANARLASELRRVLDACAAAGVAAMPVKGLAVAERIYGDVAIRPSADLDLLVRRSDLERSRDVLRELGFRQRTTHRYPALAHQYHEPVWAVGDGAAQVRLELHRALWDPLLFGLPVEEVWTRARPGVVLGHPAWVPSLEDMLVHLVIHRNRSALRLRWTCDVAELTRRHGTALDWNAFAATATRAGARTVAWLGLDLAARLLDAPVPPDVIAGLRPSRVRAALLDRTAGARAMLATAAGNRDPSEALRALEHDGPIRIGSAMAVLAARQVRRMAHETGVRPLRHAAPGPNA